MQTADDLTERIIGAAIEVHRHVGPGLLESVYDECLAVEFELRNIHAVRQYRIPLNYKGRVIGKDLVADYLVEETVLVELKAVEQMIPVHAAQLLSHMKLTGKSRGLLINFNVPLLKDGIKRMIL